MLHLLLDSALPILSKTFEEICQSRFCKSYKLVNRLLETAFSQLIL